MAVFGGGFTGTPNVGFGLSDTAREVRMGWRMNPAAQVDTDFELDLDAIRREDGTGTEHGIGVRAPPRREASADINRHVTSQSRHRLLSSGRTRIYSHAPRIGQ